MQIYRSPHEFGFTNGALKACCGGGGPFNYNSSMKCGLAYATVCDQPDTYVSWDGVHLTEAAYKHIFKGLFQGPYTTPQFNSLCPTSTSSTDERQNIELNVRNSRSIYRIQNEHSNGKELGEAVKL